LWKNPGLTLTVLLTLALGIGANTAIFTVDYATLLAPMPYPAPDQLVVVWSKIQTFHNGISAGEFTAWKRETQASGHQRSRRTFNIASKDQPEHRRQTSPPSFYKMFGSLFLMGRDFCPEEGVEAGITSSSSPQTLGAPRLRSQNHRPIHAHHGEPLHRGSVLSRA
jgi:putative ABC transport system permease protein